MVVTVTFDRVGTGVGRVMVPSIEGGKGEDEKCGGDGCDPAVKLLSTRIAVAVITLATFCRVGMVVGRTKGPSMGRVEEEDGSRS